MSLHLMREIEQLKKMIFELCTTVEESLTEALHAITEKNNERAAEVIANDRHIDLMELDVEEECLKILALYQPVAADLRFIIAALKINNDLERIGDLATNIAERTEIISRYPETELSFDFSEMYTKSIAMLHKSLDAYANNNVDLCYEVCSSDDEIDSMNKKMYSIVNKEVNHDPSVCELMLQYLSISRYLERVADHATNIAEDVIYMIEGTIVRHREAQ
ncbi:MAG: phosphate signaling complex protein PhoU [Chitinivibrionales bacterium]|nr:phosphate signaling complex protein PhoU [Chitinivibrionales bacterium]